MKNSKEGALDEYLVACQGEINKKFGNTNNRVLGLMQGISSSNMHDAYGDQLQKYEDGWMIGHPKETLNTAILKDGTVIVYASLIVD